MFIQDTEQSPIKMLLEGLMKGTVLILLNFCGRLPGQGFHTRDSEVFTSLCPALNPFLPKGFRIDK